MDKIKSKNKSVFISGHFNVVHPGHLRLFRFAKELGNYLIIGVENDLVAGDAGYIPEKLRIEGLQSNKLVDEVVLIDKSVSKTISYLKPDIVLKGKEWETRLNLEEKIIQDYGGKLVFNSGEALFSTQSFLNKVFFEKNTKSISKPINFLKRHNIELSSSLKILKDFSNLNVCIIGDLIIDEYISCQPLGMSQEEPSVVVTPIDREKFVGGAGIVAAHSAGLGAKVNFISVAGDDKTKKFAIKKLEEYGVNHKLFIDENRPTTLKQRYRCSGKSMLRVSHLHQNIISLDLQNQIFSFVKKILNSTDLIVFSDFNYGVLPQTLVNRIIKLANKNNILVSADSQSSSQIGDISRFKNTFLLTPTEREASLAVKNKDSGIVLLAESLRKKTNAKNILLKLGEDGVLIHSEDRTDNDKWNNDQLPALNNFPKDVSGAGDSLLITTSMALCCNASIWEASYIGSIAAAIQVSRVGNIPLQLEELINELKK
jgi:rfaE bifunctional protein kinase chain/domain